MIIIGYRFGLRFTFEVMRTDGDCGLRSHGNKQLRQSFAADSKSQVQWDSLPCPALLFTNIPRSAIRNPRFPWDRQVAATNLSSVICQFL